MKFADQVVQNDVDAIGSQRSLLTPALTRELTQCCTTATASGLQLEGGSRHVTLVETEVARVVPRLVALAGPSLPSVTTAQAERAIKPGVIALGVFGGIAGLAALLIVGQVIGRLLRRDVDELVVLRALGATPAMTVGDGLLGVVGAVVAGSLLAVLVAAGLSPLAPIGPVRAVYPTRGVAWDWTVLGLGVAALVAGLSALAAVVALGSAPHRTRRGQHTWRGDSALARAAISSGLPVPAVTGIRFAVQPGGGARRHPCARPCSAPAWPSSSSSPP